MITEYDEVKAILNRYPEAYAKILDDGEVNDNEQLYEDLFGYYMESGEMPYGTMKARDGDPVEWISMRLDDLGLFEGPSIIFEGDKSDDDGNPISEYEQGRADHEQDRINKGEDQ